MRRLLAVLLALGASPLFGACVFGGGHALTVDAIFADIGDLPRFANVQSADVKVGTVRGIRLDGYHARVTMRIDANADIPSNVEALIRSTSLLGEKFVDLRVPAGEMPSAEKLRDGQVIPLARTSRVPGLDDALVKLGRLLEGRTSADLATLIHSSAEIVRGREEALGELFSKLRPVTDVFAARAPDIASAISNLNDAFSSLQASRDVISRSLSSSADATQILANQQTDLDRLVRSLDNASSVLARLGNATTAADDRALKDLRATLGKVMLTTGDLSKSLTALARFVDLWPKAIPGDYIQLDVVVQLSDMGPPQSASAATAQQAANTAELRRLHSLADLLLRAAR